MPEFKKVLFIINKFSGTGYSAELEDKIVQTGKSHGVEVFLEFTQAPKHAIVLARDGRDKFDAVIAVGGDGTINEVAQGLVDGETPLGIIPRGSGNGLARHLGIALSVDGALQTIFSGQKLRIDSFLLNDRLSLNVSGIGFDGHIANLFGGSTKRGLMGYARLALKEFIQFRQFEVKLETGEVSEELQSFIIAIANSSQYGNNASIAPTASVRDGLLHLNILKKIPIYRFDFVYAFFNKALDQSPYCSIRTITNAVIKSSKPLPFHVDGEPCGVADHFTIRVLPANLPIIVPNKGPTSRFF